MLIVWIPNQYISRWRHIQVYTQYSDKFLMHYFLLLDYLWFCLFRMNQDFFDFFFWKNWTLASNSILIFLSLQPDVSELWLNIIPTKDETSWDDCTQFVYSVFLHSGFLVGQTWPNSVLNHLVNHQNTQWSAETKIKLKIVIRLEYWVSSVVGNPVSCFQI